MIVAIVAIVGLALTIVQANLTPELRLISISVVFLLSLALLVGVGYEPLEQYRVHYSMRSNADRVAKKNMSRLLDLTKRFRTIASSGYTDSIASAVFNIRNSQIFKDKVRYENTYHFDTIAQVIDDLGDQKMTYALFYQLCTLFNSALREFNEKISGAVLEIRLARDGGAALPPDLAETYRLARGFYINFITDVRNLGGDIDKELGTNPQNIPNPYRNPIGYLAPPHEL